MPPLLRPWLAFFAMGHFSKWSKRFKEYVNISSVTKKKNQKRRENITTFFLKSCCRYDFFIIFRNLGPYLHKYLHLHLHTLYLQGMPSFPLPKMSHHLSALVFRIARYEILRIYIVAFFHVLYLCCQRPTSYINVYTLSTSFNFNWWIFKKTYQHGGDGKVIERRNESAPVHVDNAVSPVEPIPLVGLVFIFLLAGRTGARLSSSRVVPVVSALSSRG